MSKSNLIFYGWLIVAAGIVIKVLGYGSRYSFSVIFPSLLEDFHWPRDTTALMLSIHLLSYGLTAPIAGALVDRIGPRRTMGCGFLILALGLAVSRFATSPWHFYISFGIFTGSGLCLAGSVPLATIITNWFEKYRGTALSIMSFGDGSAHILYPAIAFLIATLGWRDTFLVQAAIIIIVCLPLVAMVIRYHPREKGLVRDGFIQAADSQQAKARETTKIVDAVWASTDWTLLKAMKTYRFWMLCLAAFSIWGVMQHVVVAHHIAFAEDVGYSRMHASAILSLFGVMYAFGSLSGIISDHIGRESGTTIATAIGVSGIAVLMFIKDTSQPWMFYYYAISAGFGIGMTLPLIQASLTDIFQGSRVGAVFGFVWFSFALGGAIGPWLGGWIFEFAGSYKLAFFISEGMFIVGCVAIWLAAPRCVRLVPGRAKAR